ncbi:MAG: hypothetical protein ABI425_02675 [Patescibacteria group bacterium]
MKFYPISSTFSQAFDGPTNAQDLSGMLFERTAHMEGLQKEFSKLLLLPKKKKDKWIKIHKDFIQEMLHKIRNESSIMIHEFTLNELTRRTVTEYMVTVQQTLSTLEKIVDEGKELRAN